MILSWCSCLMACDCWLLALSLQSAAGTPHLHMKSLWALGNSDSVFIPSMWISPEVHPWKPCEQLWPSIDLVDAKWVSVAVTSFDLGCFSCSNWLLQCQTRGCLITALASWVVCSRVHLMTSLGLKAKWGDDFSQLILLGQAWCELELVGGSSGNSCLPKKVLTLQMHSPVSSS